LLARLLGRLLRGLLGRFLRGRLLGHHCSLLCSSAGAPEHALRGLGSFACPLGSTCSDPPAMRSAYRIYADTCLSNPLFAQTSRATRTTRYIGFVIEQGNQRSATHFFSPN